MTQVTLFDLEPAPVVESEWDPIFEPTIESLGWHWSPEGNSIPLHKDGSKVTHEEWKQYLGAGRCRDCGVKCGMEQGGGGDGGGYRLCNPCAQLDGARIVTCTTKVERRPGMYQRDQAAHCLDCGWSLDVDHWADEGGLVPYTPEEVIDLCGEHEQPRYVSRWGRVHRIEEHDRLVAEREKRRAAYRRGVQRG